MASRKQIIPITIAEVVDSMREANTISASSEVSGVYELTSTNSLGKDHVITIDAIDYLVKSATADIFFIDAETGIDFVGEVWKTKAPYYEFGSPVEIVNTLKERTSGIYQNQKFPLIALFTDIKEVSDITGVSAPLNIIIANNTQQTYKAYDRVINNFEPVLYPLLGSFENALRRSKLVDTISITYDQTDHYNWGKESIYGHDGNIFDDHIDAIELQGLNLKFKPLNC